MDIKKDDTFPNPSEPIQDIFRICGKCPRCKNEEKSSRRIDNFKKTRIDIKEPHKLFSDEYILICSSGRPLPKHNQMACGGDNNIPTEYISNYGRRFCIHDHGRGCHGQIEEITDNWGKKIKLSPLTPEFINIYNSVNFMGGQYSHVFRKQDSLNMILEYQKNSEQPVIFATEVVPQATAPPQGYYASLTSLGPSGDGSMNKPNVIVSAALDVVCGFLSFNWRAALVLGSMNKPNVIVSAAIDVVCGFLSFDWRAALVLGRWLLWRS